MKGKNSLVENNMSRDENFSRGWIITAVPTMIRRIAEEHTRHRPRTEFVLCGGGDISVAQATEDTESIIRWWMTVETRIGNGRPYSFTGAAI
jgi:hypothetical protein